MIDICDPRGSGCAGMTSAYKIGQSLLSNVKLNSHLGHQDRFCSVTSVVHSWTSLRMETIRYLVNNVTMKNQLIVGGRWDSCI